VKVAFVTVRYGRSIVGGAEQACRQLAEHLAPTDEVSVYTTCAVDSVTWADELPAGTTVDAGVTVHRFRSVRGRDRRFEDLSQSVLNDPAHQPAPAQRRWLDAQGPVCPDAIDAAADSGADLVVCSPYLYWPAVETVRRLGARAILHPAAHDEAPIHLPMFAETFARAGGLAFYTDAERRLVERLWPSLTATPQMVCGVGIDPRRGDPARFRARVGDAPYLLCLGRVDHGKGTDLLTRFFITYKRRRPGPLRLVFAGTVVHPPPDHPDIVVTGPLEEEEKLSALAGASLFVHPSANESFSIVLLEAWAAERPALVNARCAATAEHVRRSGGGLTFGSYAAFETEVDRLLGDTSLAAAMGAAGRSYVETSFAWPAVIGRYRRWLSRLAH
jgi:glycosyltransferase involved in cell wall biosynthesis